MKLPFDGEIGCAKKKVARVGTNRPRALIALPHKTMALNRQPHIPLLDAQAVPPEAQSPSTPRKTLEPEAEASRARRVSSQMFQAS